MRLWVREEYAPELAVVFAWFAALIPWNVALSELELGTVVFVRFPFLQVRYTYGVPLARGVRLVDPYAAYQFQLPDSPAVADAYAVAGAGAALLGVAVVLSVAMYLAERQVAAAVRDPVAVMGVLLLVAGGLNAVATVLLATRGFPELPLPVGAVLEAAFGVALLRARRV